MTAWSFYPDDENYNQFRWPQHQSLKIIRFDVHHVHNKGINLRTSYIKFKNEHHNFLITFKNIRVALFNHHVDQLGTLKSMLMQPICVP